MPLLSCGPLPGHLASRSQSSFHLPGETGAGGESEGLPGLEGHSPAGVQGVKEQARGAQGLLGPDAPPETLPGPPRSDLGRDAGPAPPSFLGLCSALELLGRSLVGSPGAAPSCWWGGNVADAGRPRLGPDGWSPTPHFLNKCNCSVLGGWPRRLASGVGCHACGCERPHARHTRSFGARGQPLS